MDEICKCFSIRSSKPKKYRNKFKPKKYGKIKSIYKQSRLTKCRCHKMLSTRKIECRLKTLSVHVRRTHFPVIENEYKSDYISYYCSQGKVFQ